MCGCYHDSSVQNKTAAGGYRAKPRLSLWRKCDASLPPQRFFFLVALLIHTYIRGNCLTNCVYRPKHARGRLFRSTGWTFLVDAVRVRPLHEEMTASLLEEVEKIHAQKTSRRSVSRDSPGFAGTVMAATGSTTAAAAAATPSTTAVGARESSSASATAGTAATTPNNPTLGGSGRIMDAAAVAPAGVSVRSHPLGGVAPLGDREEKGAADKDQTTSKEGGGAAGTAVQGQAEAAAATKRRVEAERRRRAALATIDKRRSHHHHHHTASAAPSSAATAAPTVAAAEGPSGSTRPLEAAAQEGSETLRAATASSAATMPTTTSAVSSGSHVAAAAAAAALRPSSRLSTAFSTHSVRSGATLGYYGREEVDVLSAISKNPSRIAAYNRITEGKRGKDGDTQPSSEVGVFGWIRQRFDCALDVSFKSLMGSFNSSRK